MLVCLALVVIAASAIYLRVIQFDMPLFWDEQVHAMAGLQLADDLARGDPMSAVWDTYSAVFYPPVFYWLEALSFTVLGPSRIAARLASLAALALLGWLLFAAGRHLRDDGNPWVGVIAFGFIAVSIPLGQLVGQAMLESAGLMMMMAALWIYLSAVRRGGGWRWGLAGVFTMLTYLTRPHFGCCYSVASC
jgi:4-amino-4-deoxy-L-arabinose transferase-like glycosyltransferase